MCAKGPDEFSENPHVFYILLCLTTKDQHRAIRLKLKSSQILRNGYGKLFKNTDPGKQYRILTFPSMQKNCPFCIVNLISNPAMRRGITVPHDVCVCLSSYPWLRFPTRHSAAGVGRSTGNPARSAARIKHLQRRRLPPALQTVNCEKNFQPN